MSEYQVVFEHEESLRKAYMPFIQLGGLFISLPTGESQPALGDEVSVQVKLPKDPEFTLLKAKVIWLAPPANGSHEAGFGVQFLADKSHLRNRIETILGHLVQSDHPTSTM